MDSLDQVTILLNLSLGIGHESSLEIGIVHAIIELFVGVKDSTSVLAAFLIAHVAMLSEVWVLEYDWVACVAIHVFSVVCGPA